MNLILAAIAPVVIIALYIYFKDKYNKEPIAMLAKALVLGMLTVIPVLLLEGFLMEFISIFDFSTRLSAFYNAFVVAAFSEEIWKFIALYILIWKSKEFDESIDGIVYAVFVGLGFAMVENIMYVVNGGGSVALMRAFLAVPAHALFGVTMGYYFSLSKFAMDKASRNKYYRYAIISPIILHGVYDFILMANEPLGMLVFIPFIIYLWKTGFKRIKALQ
ncbi:MAG: PrsW family intramembrane metalloprotease [Bacteroidales bacterium]|nr:PrsW family intramembrane metalloprotease [Bacteroidales bacterium]